MDGPEGVLDEELSETGELGGEPGVVRLLSRMKTQVLEEEELAVLEPSGELERLHAHDVAGEGNRLAQEGAQAMGHGAQAEARVPLPVRPSEMRHEDRPRTGRSQVVERGKCLDDPTVVRNLAGGVLGDVEIDPDEHASASDGRALHPSLGQHRRGEGPPRIGVIFGSRRRPENRISATAARVYRRSRPWPLAERRISPEMASTSVGRPRSKSCSMLDRFSAVARTTRSRSARASSSLTSIPTARAARAASSSRWAASSRYGESRSRPFTTPWRAVTGLTAALTMAFFQTSRRRSGTERVRMPASRSRRSKTWMEEAEGPRASGKTISPSPATRTSPGRTHVAGREFTARTRTRSGSLQPPDRRARAATSSIPSPFCGRSTGVPGRVPRATAAAAAARSKDFTVRKIASGTGPGGSSSAASTRNVPSARPVEPDAPLPNRRDLFPSGDEQDGVTRTIEVRAQDGSDRPGPEDDDAHGRGLPQSPDQVGQTGSLAPVALEQPENALVVPDLVASLPHLEEDVPLLAAQPVDLGPELPLDQAERLHPTGK